MKRISLTLDEETLRQLDKWINSLFETDFKGNRSGYLNNLIAKYVPKLPED